MRPARLIVYQSPRNPTPRERRILTSAKEVRATTRTVVVTAIEPENI